MPALPGVQGNRLAVDQQVAARGDLAFRRFRRLRGVALVFLAEMQAVAEGQVPAGQLGALLRHFRADFLAGFVEILRDFGPHRAGLRDQGRQGNDQGCDV